MILEECTYYCGPYKGYHGKATLQGNLFHGEVMGVQDIVTFQGHTPAELRNAFCESVDDYLAFCRQRGEEPAKPYSGKFMTRLPAELHRELSEKAERAGKSMNQYLVDLLTDLVREPSKMAPRRQLAKKSPRRRHSG
jgi:predicted HicB family RNase H-like nuclease